MKYKTKAKFIEAVQWTVDIESEGDITKLGCNCEMSNHPDYLRLFTRNGVVLVAPWDYVIKRTDNDFDVYKSDVFEMNYEAAE